MRPGGAARRGGCFTPPPTPPFQLEGQCATLHTDQHETRAENTKLKLTNQELTRELEQASRELQGAQRQLESLQQEACKLHQEKEM